MVQYFEIHFQWKARIANEQQNTPSIKACSSKTDSVISPTIQQPRTTEILFLTKVVSESQLTLLNCFSNSPRLSN